jgi:5-methylcytosine-specific restriction endonuclease McrA
MRPDPKPEPRVIDQAAGLEKVWTEGRCRLCGYRRSLARHHLVKRSQGGDDVDANLVPLCVACHDGVESSLGFRALLRRVLRPEEWAYIVAKIGEARARQQYP